jgi:hypothetical protein
MERGHPFANLPTYVAYARTRGRPTRLVLRNTERFGLVHLYFQSGHLARVEGHAGSPLNSIADLASWQFGVIRQDDVPGGIADGVADASLESALSGVLRELESRGVVRPVPPARMPSRRGPAGRPSSVRPGASVPPPASVAPGQSGPLRLDVPPYPDTRAGGEVPPQPGATGLPSLDSVAPPEGIASQAAARAEGPDSQRITDPQWQLVALVVHQVLEQAVGVIGGTMAEGLLRQALGHAAKSHRVARDVELDDSGWLKTTAGHTITRYTAFDVADAIAALLTGFELRCASLVGAEQAQRIIASAAAPFRTSLAQIGLDVSA